MTTSMIAVSRSSRIDHEESSVPDWIQRMISRCWAGPSTVKNTIQDRNAARNRSAVANQQAAASPRSRQPKPQTRLPISGAKRMIVVTASALHDVDVFGVDRAAV